MTVLLRCLLLIIPAAMAACAQSPGPNADQPTTVLQHQSGPMFEPAPVPEIQLQAPPDSSSAATK